MNNVDLQKVLPELAKRIRSARENAHLSQAELAKGVGVSDKSISAYEQGRSTPPFGKLKLIATNTQHPLAFFTDDNTGDATIESKLISVETTLGEIKELLKKRKAA